jgi:hypothetical protein
VGEQDLEGEGLGEIIVGADIEALHDVAGGIACGQHEDGSAVASFAEVARDFETAYAGQHDIENQQVNGAGRGKLETVAAIHGDGDHVAVFHETLPEEFRHPALVFDYQNPHSRTEDSMVSGKPEDFL